jgi:hypothetical protein
MRYAVVSLLRARATLFVAQVTLMRVAPSTIGLFFGDNDFKRRSRSPRFPNLPAVFCLSDRVAHLKWRNLTRYGVLCTLELYEIVSDQIMMKPE